MACSDMEESGKWTDIFIKKNGWEHLLNPHSFFLPPGLFLASPSTVQQLLQMTAFPLPALTSNRALKEASCEWWWCVWSSNWKTVPSNGKAHRGSDLILLFFPSWFCFSIAELSKASPPSGSIPELQEAAGCQVIKQMSRRQNSKLLSNRLGPLWIR
jgi:hypothetical protein